MVYNYFISILFYLFEIKINLKKKYILILYMKLNTYSEFTPTPDKFKDNRTRNLSSLKSKQNCSPLNQTFVIDEKTSILSDVCHNNGKNIQSDSVNDYMLSNFADCDCDIKNVVKTATENRGLIIKDGYGTSECNIDSESALIIGTVKRNHKVDQQLFPRPFATTPFIQRGEPKPDLESRLISSLQTIKHKQMQNVSLEDNVFTPMTSNLAATIQDPIHLIQENVNRTWLRGGIPSRQSVKDFDYFANSSDNNTIKQLLRSRKSYL
jgi:hypothetical protein